LKLRLAITGSAGRLAQRLIARLGSDPEVEFVLGLDIRPHPSEAGCPAEFLHFDLTAYWEELRDLLRSRRINAGVHLAWQSSPIHNRRRHRQVDIGGSRNFFRAAAAAGLERMVYVGSTAAYVNPNNSADPPYLSEDTPVTGTPQYPYSLHKAEVDRMAQEFMAEHPEMQILILRLPVILGPHTYSLMSGVLDWPSRSFPKVFQVRGCDPPMQFLAEEDSVEILYRAVKSEARGIFNAAGDGVVRFSEVARRAGKGLLNLPAWLAYPAAAILWNLHLTPFHSGLLDMTRYPWVADNTRLKTVFGYAPRLTTREALERYVMASQSESN